MRPTAVVLMNQGTSLVRAVSLTLIVLPGPVWVPPSKVTMLPTELTDPPPRLRVSLSLPPKIEMAAVVAFT